MAILAGTRPTLIDTMWPGAEAMSVPKFVRLAILALAGSALLAVSAKIQVPMWPVPMTMQTFAVLVIGMAYGLRLGAATVALYLFEGGMGLPVFASGFGWAYLAGPTGGYLVGFLVAAAAVGWLAEQGWDRSPVYTFLANVAGTAIIFGLGATWLAIFMGSAPGAIEKGVMPFLVGALIKILLATAVLPAVWALLTRYRR